MCQLHAVRRANTAATGRTNAGAPTPAKKTHAATRRSQVMAPRRSIACCARTPQRSYTFAHSSSLIARHPVQGMA